MAMGEVRFLADLRLDMGCRVDQALVDREVR